jgi:hypothetical protein
MLNASAHTGNGSTNRLTMGKDMVLVNVFVKKKGRERINKERRKKEIPH